jgi:hypothetical protein
MSRHPSTPELLDAVAEEEELSQIIPAVFSASPRVPIARWTFARDDDADAPEITCILSDGDEALARVLEKTSRSEGHGLRSVVDTQPADDAGVVDTPSVVVTLII